MILGLAEDRAAVDETAVKNETEEEEEEEGEEMKTTNSAEEFDAWVREITLGDVHVSDAESDAIEDAGENANNNNNRHRHRDARCSAPPGWHRESAGNGSPSWSPTASPSRGAVAALDYLPAPDPYGWAEDDTFHDVVASSEQILRLEKAHHLHYLLEYRVRQCPLFLLGMKNALHRWFRTFCLCLSRVAALLHRFSTNFL